MQQAVLPFFFDLVGPIVRLLLASGSVLVLVLVDAIWGGMGLVTLGITDPSSSFSNSRGDKSKSAASVAALNMDDADVDMVDPETDVEDRDVEPVAHAPPTMVLFFLFLFLPLFLSFVLMAIAVLCKPGCAVSTADVSSVQALVAYL